jgi:hypothetical protein
MRVNNTGRNENIGKSGTKNKASGSSSFSLDSTNAAGKSSVSQGSAVGQMQAVDMILALQGIDDALDGKKKAINHGFDLLDQLEAIKIDILAGKISGDKLLRIVHTLGKREASGDGALDAIIQEIELRAKVELAKFGHYVS